MQNQETESDPKSSKFEFPTLDDLEIPTVPDSEYLKSWAQDNWVRTVHLFDKNWPYGGTTICYAPEVHDSQGYPRGKFARVSVSYCNTKDRYNRKLGQQLALENMYDGRYILLPIYTNKNPVVVLRDFFNSMQPSFEW